MGENMAFIHWSYINEEEHLKVINVWRRRITSFHETDMRMRGIDASRDSEKRRVQ